MKDKIKIPKGFQLISEKAISYLYDNFPEAYKGFYELVDGGESGQLDPIVRADSAEIEQLKSDLYHGEANLDNMKTHYNNAVSELVAVKKMVESISKKLIQY